jgi:hypothetical protein
MRPSAPAPIPVARNRAASSRSRPASTEAPKSGGVPAFVILLIVLVLAGAGAGGWWYWQQKQAPAKAAGQFFESIQKKDWKSMYNLIELAPEQKARATEEQFVAGMSMVGGMINIKKYEVGEATVTGDTAKVKVTVTASLNVPGMPGGDRTNTQEIPMKKINGKWKLDATSARGGSMPGLGGLGGPGSGQ